MTRLIPIPRPDRRQDAKPVKVLAVECPWDNGQSRQGPAADRLVAEKVIKTESLSVAYRGMCALNRVSFDAIRGRITAVVGPSGCGKSSFLSTLNRLTDLIPGCVVTGRVTLDGQDIHDAGADVIGLRRRVGMIFQKPNPFPLSIRRNLELPLKEHGVRGRTVRATIVEKALHDVGLWAEVRDRLDRPALMLSGGQQQRLCIARALALEPEVVLFDEPCSSLDPISSGVVEDLIHSLRGRVTVVIVTHNLAQAKRIADDVAVFWVKDGSGRLIEAGPAKQVFYHPSDPITSAYLAGARG